MKRRTILRIVFGACFLTALAIGGTLWFLPPQFQPWVVYNLKFGGLYPAMRDAGEGTLIDYGPRAAIYRYVVDLGDLTAASRIDKTFLVSGLPAEEFTLGFDVSGSTGTGSLLFDTPNIGTVLVEVTTESGDPIVLEKGPLSDWIWSGPLARDDYAFVYRISGRFTAHSGSSYRIRLSSTWESETPSQYKIGLVMKGGGWQCLKPMVEP